MKIAPPPSTPHPDRFLRCQEAMQDAFSTIAISAEAAGWDPEEVAAAMVELADHLMLGVIMDRDLTLILQALDKR